MCPKTEIQDFKPKAFLKENAEEEKLQALLDSNDTLWSNGPIMRTLATIRSCCVSHTDTQNNFFVYAHQNILTKDLKRQHRNKVIFAKGLISKIYKELI